MFGLGAVLGLGAKAVGGLFGGGGDKKKGPNPYEKGESYVQKTASLVPRIQNYGNQFARSGWDLQRAANRLDSYNPWQGLDKEVGAITAKLTPGFNEQMQGIRENAASRGVYRGGQELMEEGQAFTDFQDRVAMALAERGTQRSQLELQGRQASVQARSGMSDRYMDALAAESDIYGGMADYYNQWGNAQQQAKSQEKAGTMDFLGDLAGAALSFF